MMPKIDNHVMEVRTSAGKGKTIQVPLFGIAVIQSDGTARDVSATDPLPTISTSGTATANALGTTVDDVLAGETLEDSTARTGISLWKRAVNMLIGIKALLAKGTSIMTGSLPVTIATDDEIFTGTTGHLWQAANSQSVADLLYSTSGASSVAESAFEIDNNAGSTNNAAVDGDAAGTMSAKLRGINKVLALVNAKQAALDDVAGITRQIDDAHAHVHESEAWKVHHVLTTAATDGHRTGIAFKTPNTTTKGHFVMTIGSSHPAEFFLVEAPSASDFTAGADQVIFNRDRNAGTTSVMASLEGTPTVGSASTFTEAQMVTAAFTGGTEIDHTVLAVGSNPREVGGTSRGTQEFILKVNTIYLMFLQNIGANANIHDLEADWYEHADVA